MILEAGWIKAPGDLEECTASLSASRMQRAILGAQLPKPLHVLERRQL